MLLAPRLEARGRFRSPVLLLRKPEPEADPQKDFGNRACSLGLKVVPLQEFRLKGGWLRKLPKRMGVQVIHVHGQRANYFVWMIMSGFIRVPGGRRNWSRPCTGGCRGKNFVRKAVTWLEWARIARMRPRYYGVRGNSAPRCWAWGSRRQGHGGKAGHTVPGGSGLHAPTPQERSDARAKWGLPDDAFVVTAIGRLSTEKRFDLYLEVCALLKEQIPDARFMLVGGGKQEASLRAQATSLGLDGRLLLRA